ncbi:DUF3386 domain-containing protein [Microcoleus sp. FACHB-672]|uniref:DUF3386 domain-containing protein n=1 Tax=Microcoleus sp. FACHB-672 TaxID=2692825 RepID=UPI0016879580|nr:DUF3386 domain-containing protein [Microcoleus sp. FACHB-672]MBD2041243.1 DUF3386 domain-containing protein [Microcoleus sp. FACHB-672]
MQQSLKRQIVLWGLSVILTVVGWGFSGPAFAQSTSALDLFRTAYENRYTWDSKFPGYTATVEVKQDGETYKGQIRINSDLSIEVAGIESKDASETVSNQMRMMVTHRRSVPFKLAHGKHTFTFGETPSAGAIHIDQKGGDTPSYYEVKAEKITQVNRFTGPVLVTVDLLDSEDTPAGYLGTRYIATFKYAQTGDVLEKLEFKDTYQKIGDYYISTHQSVRSLELGQQDTTEVKSTDIHLLPASERSLKTAYRLTSYPSLQVSTFGQFFAADVDNFMQKPELSSNYPSS